MATVRERLLRGERVKVRADHGGGFLYLAADGEFTYECHEGWAEGVTEAVCFHTSPYLEDSFLRTFEAV